MIITNPLYDFDDLLILPETVSTIQSRKRDTNALDVDGFLPLFTAPMDTVVDPDNTTDFIKNRIRPILPRTADSYDGYVSYNNWIWRSYSIEQFETTFVDGNIKNRNDHIPMYALIDVANGHMSHLYKAVQSAKAKWTNLVVMVGNIANPSTFKYAAQCGADYVRVGIGNGNACLTTQQTGVGYPMASLIADCYEIREEYKIKPKIVADGGMKKYSDIIKALALGADYVMLGSLLNKALESCSPTMVDCGNNYYRPLDLYLREQAEKKRIDNVLMSTPLWTEEVSVNTLLKSGMLVKEFRGMSTKEVQRSWGKETLTTSEGVRKYQKVEYTLESWSNNFYDYLRTAMSYTNSRNLAEFIGGCKLQVITQNAYNRFNK